VALLDAYRTEVARTAGAQHSFRDMDADVDRALFAKMPKDVRALNRKARGEARAKQRFEWANDNPEHPNVVGKPLKKP
jgi:hypothetical protein